MKMQKRLFILFIAAVGLCSCTTTQQIGKSARQNVLHDAALQNAHVGISIYEPATGRYWYNYQGEKYFVPASNTKIATCYAAMKYLGDSLVGLRYGIPEEKGLKEKVIALEATGDPTFLQEDYKFHPTLSFLREQLKGLNKLPGILVKPDKFEHWGSGWSWNDYEAPYMAERSGWPIYGNVVTIQLNELSKRTYIDSFLTPGKRMMGRVFITHPSYFDSVVNKRIIGGVGLVNVSSPKLEISRSISANEFRVQGSDRTFTTTSIPFVTNWYQTAINLVQDTLQINKSWSLVVKTEKKNEYMWDSEDGDIAFIHISKWHAIHSQPTDSLLKPMMHRSDNFFAEQSLLMVSNELLGYMNDARITDTLLKTDFSDLPQKPRWVDGSGLSRYNLFTPQDFVFILNKMKNEFGMDRIREILPTGNEGTLRNYYKADSSFIYAKTGTLSGVVALSGFLYTQKGRELVFSVLVNNHQASATQVRRAVEKFLQGVRNKF